MAVDIKNIHNVVTGLRRHTNDTGSSEVQVAQLTGRILSVSMHLERFPKDIASRKGLLALVTQRRKLLEYLKMKSYSRYAAAIGALELRK